MADDKTNARCAIARAVQWKDKPAEIRARQDLGEAMIADRIKKVLASAPPLRDDQRSRLAELLKPVR
jgi:hypothetical protein